MSVESVGSDAHIAPVIAAGNDPAVPAAEASGDASLRPEAAGAGMQSLPVVADAHIGPTEAIGNRQQTAESVARAICPPDKASGIRHQASGDEGCETAGNGQQAIGAGGTDCHDRSADWSGNDKIGNTSPSDNCQLSLVTCHLSLPPAPAREAFRRLNAAGYEAYLVGGCVRDALLGREPGDWDITTSALPEQTEAVFAGERIIETGLKHGTVTVLLEGLPLEITTFRTETGYSDHRHPDAVAFTRSLEEDLARRDFTINAMAWAPVETPLIRHRACGGRPMPPSPEGEGFAGGRGTGIVDPYGGQADLEGKRIRCVGDPYKRFEEDALRILRALRFASQLDFSVDPATAAAALARKDTLALVSKERLAVELTKLLCGPGVRRIVTEFWPILAVPLPELAPMAGLDQRSPYHCYDVLEHSAVAVENVPPDRITRWAALLHDAGKPACFTVDEAGRGHFYGHAKPGAELARQALTRLRFDKDTINRVTKLVELHDYPIDPPIEPVGGGVPDAPQGSASGASGASRTPPPTEISAAERAVRRLIGKLGEEDFFRLLDLKRADALAHHPDYRGRTAACDRIGALARELLAQEAVFSLKDLAVNGSDLLELGFPRGPILGQTLNALLEAVLAGDLPNEKPVLLDAARTRL